MIYKLLIFIFIVIQNNFIISMDNDLGKKLFNLLHSFSNFIKEENELMMKFKKMTGLDANENNLKFIIKFLLDEGANVNYKNSLNKNATPLHRAFAWHSIEIIDFLIENGADVNAKDYYKTLPIERSTLNKIDVMMYYLQNKNFLNKLNEKDKIFDKLLWRTANANKIPFMEFLINNGANVNGKVIGYTHLKGALLTASKEAVELLLRKGADPNILDDRKSSESLLYWCLNEIHEYYKECINDLTERIENVIEIAKLLLRYGAKYDNNVKTKYNSTWNTNTKITKIFNEHRKLISDQKQAASEITNFIPVPAIANIISQYYL